jgi:uncharacterized membrane protein YfcA
MHLSVAGALPALPPSTLAELVLIAVVAGIGITTVGPGGVLLTIGIYAITGLPPALVAGTSIVTHIATGIAGTLAYIRSGQLRHPITRRMALILAAAAVIATPLGVLSNSHVSHRQFGLLLALFAATIGMVVWRRQSGYHCAPSEREYRVTAAAPVVLIGVGVAAASGRFGLGGPMMTVPLLVAAHVPILSAVAAAQAQSLTIAGIGTFGYLARGAIDWPLALYVTIPEIAGVMLGWKIAHRVPPRRLGYALALVLFCLAPYLALHGA